MKSREEHMRNFLSGFDIGQKRGIEIGAYDRPVFPRSTYPQIEYADVFTTDEIRTSAAQNPKRNADAVVTVDHVLRNEKLSELIEPGSVDFVFCSHVLEHVPDLIAELQGIESILKPGSGLLLCAYPDRRFTFDIDRQPTTIETLRNRHALGLKMPDPDTVYDYFVHYRDVFVGKIWQGMPDDRGPRRYTPELARTKAQLATETYVDVHCNIFADREFESLIGGLHASGETGLKMVRFVPTTRPFNEFFFALSRSA